MTKEPTMSDTDTMPPGCRRGASINRNAIFRALYDRWIAAKKGRSGAALCEALQIRKQTISGYRNDHQGRVAPWWVLMRMMSDLRMEARVTEHGIVLTGRRGRGPGGPATRAADIVLPLEG
jgi:hypothetical protein